VTLLRWVLALIAFQRGIELLYARRNTRALLARGAHEVAAWQHPLFVALHASWLLAMLLFIPAAAAANWWLLGAVAALQLARIWVIASLGPYWTTRIITLPGAPLVRSGPYALLPHPNYAIVCLEIALVPGAFGAWWISVAFTLLNGALLALRLQAEEPALAARRARAAGATQKGSENVSK
jgi:methyltransferase